jgi:hypothetical protein
MYYNSRKSRPIAMICRGLQVVVSLSTSTKIWSSQPAGKRLWYDYNTPGCYRYLHAFSCFDSLHVYSYWHNTATERQDEHCPRIGSGDHQINLCLCTSSALSESVGIVEKTCALYSANSWDLRQHVGSDRVTVMISCLYRDAWLGY